MLAQHPFTWRADGLLKHLPLPGTCENGRPQHRASFELNRRRARILIRPDGERGTVHVLHTAPVCVRAYRGGRPDRNSLCAYVTTSRHADEPVVTDLTAEWR